MDKTAQSSNYAARAQFHARAAETVRAKIRKHYGVSDEGLRLPNTPWVDTLNHTFDTSIASDKWQKTRDELLQWNKQNPDSAALDATARTILERYANAFYMHSVIAQKPAKQTPAEHRKYNKALDLSYYLSRILINHLSNQAEAELAAQGFNEADAHRLHSRLIGIAIGNYKQCFPIAKIARYAEVNPKIGSASDKTVSEISDGIMRVKNDWQKARDQLQRSHHDFVGTPRER